MAEQRIIDELVARYAQVAGSNHIPDNWELVGLAVQLIEGVPDLTGEQKMIAVKKIVAAVVQQLPLSDDTRSHLQQTLFKVENLAEVSLQLLKSNAALQKNCLACVRTSAKALHLPFPLVQ